MRELFQQYFNIAFLMGKPQDLPSGRAQMQAGVSFALVTYVLALLVPLGVERAVLQALVDLVSTGVILWMGLSIVGYAARFEQAFGGLCGASAFINLAALPLFVMLPVSPEANVGSISNTLVAEFVLRVWGLSLMAHIIRHTFEARLFVSVVMSVAFYIVLSSILAGFWPPKEGASITEEVSLQQMVPEMAYGMKDNNALSVLQLSLPASSEATASLLAGHGSAVHNEGAVLYSHRAML